MAFDDNQPEYPVPGNNSRRTAAQHLPRYFRTETNEKFISQTIDQFLNPGTAEKINGYFGRKYAKAFKQNDNYVEENLKQRSDYQFEPAAVIKDDIGNTDFYADYNDYINQIRNLGSTVKNHSILNRQEYYAWNPHIDWDKFVNFREYYWLPNGPQPVPVAGESIDVQSTYTVTNVDNQDNRGFVFTPDGFTQNPELVLYRGITYTFEIDSPNLPISFRSNRTVAPEWNARTLYRQGEVVEYEGQIYTAIQQHRSSDDFDVTKWDFNSSFNLADEVSDQNVSEGTIEVTLNQQTPDFIYYVSNLDANAGGLIRVYDIEEAAFVDVEKEIIGKKQYTSGNGVKFSNGQKVYFQGTTFPDLFETGNYYVEGVGEEIRLISESDLTLSSAFVSNEEIEFDSEPFDSIPFSTAIGFPREKDYITINRSSINGNLWSKYNRWFHREVIEQAAEINRTELDINQNARATRPIIEFEPNLKLINFGTESKQAVDLVDDFTRDVFSTIEGATGYNIDGVDVVNGMRVLFTNDPDQRVNGKIFRVEFITFQGTRQIALRETVDTEPLENQTVLCGQGNAYSGKILYYTGTEWIEGQNKVDINQEPLFDLFNCDGNSLADQSVYESSDFVGTELFSYKKNLNVPKDPELGFGISFRNLANVGDIEFEFDLLSDGLTYCPEGEDVVEENTAIGYLRNYISREDFTVENGWKKADSLSLQPIIRQYVARTNDRNFAIDVFDDSALINDIDVKVYLNNSLKIENKDYILTDNRNTLYVQFVEDLNEGDVVLLKILSSETKNDNGFYEIPINLERNPLNSNLSTLTLGEINDHVGSIVENLEDFDGLYPGSSNLRDRKDVTGLGTRIVKHSMPINLPLYHFVDNDANIIKAIESAAQDYGRFKRRFLQIAYDLPFAGDTREHVNVILEEQFRDKNIQDSYFFSDMIPIKGFKTNTFEITSSQQQFFALNRQFTLEELSNQAVLIYLNNEQLLTGKDYEFNSEGFVEILTNLEIGDELTILEYENTNGAFLPPTPTKLGLYPKFEPEIYIDDTYLTPQKVIRGHDGSVTIAFDDYRDELLLELEKRIYNNIKIEYNNQMFDIFDYLPSDGRDTQLTRRDLDESIISDFVRYIKLVDRDYIENTFFQRENTFTYNYSGSTNFQGDTVTGWWRSVYQNAYDTDAPHLRPWEMLGFSNKPNWWEQQYGPAPYTRNNLILWEDIEQGVVREPGKTVEILDKFQRPQLSSHIPVDDEGNLLSPLESGYIISLDFQKSDKQFEYGDWSPVETAWRKNSEYPFYLIKSIVLNQPNRVFASAFDRSRQFRDLTDSIVYREANNQFTLDRIVFPDEQNGIFTSGLVNYVKDYIQNNRLQSFDTYTDKIANLNTQIGFKIGGFTSKEKFSLLLDSRSPSNQGNVFVPVENYSIFVNKTKPIRNIFYSGVIIEKRENGFLIRGYNEQQQYFLYNLPTARLSGTAVNIGGISEPSIEWAPRQQLVKGIIVIRNGRVYRTIETHVTGAQFDEDKFVQLESVPVKGGRNAILPNAFDDNEQRLPYNTVLSSIQEVVDFILGYGNWLHLQGFRFDYYDREEDIVTNWITAAKEFLFWTTQNWAEGSVIALSPGAYRFNFVSETETVDDIYDTVYGYSLFKVDGKKLQSDYVSVSRGNKNTFEIRTKGTADGIYGLRISTVQKEHVILLDDRTVFNDVIYDKEPGFRQERIQVLGYRSADWNGSYNIPGFVYDNAKVEDWQPWRDYAIGDLVRYKEFFYSANNKVSGTATFELENWNRLPQKPEAELLPNWEYKSNQFADFYDLDTDNFDEEQQKFAQHLIGYQNRQYLQNIINDDVSQYKFYQGFIKEKGTKNALNKLFDALSNTDKESLEFYEEWAIKAGQYGSSKGFEQVEFLLDERRFKLANQPFELVDDDSNFQTDLIYRINTSEVYQKPSDYSTTLFPTLPVLDTFVRNAGYVNQDDINYEISQYQDLLNLNVEEITNQDKIWIGNSGNDWQVYTVLPYTMQAASITTDNGYLIEFDDIVKDLKVGEIIGLYATDDIDGIYKIQNVENNKILLEVDNPDSNLSLTSANLFLFVESRFESVTEANKNIENIERGLDRLWIDSITYNNWQVLEKTNVLNEKGIVKANTDESDGFANSIAVDSDNTVLVVGSPFEANGTVRIFTRATEQGSFSLAQTIEANSNRAKSYPIFDSNKGVYAEGDIVKRFNKHYKALKIVVQTEEKSFNPSEWQEVQPDDIQRFGESVSIDRLGNFIAIGSPGASNVKTTYRGDFDPTKKGANAAYDVGEIVRYQDRLWQAQVDILPPVDSIPFGSFESVPQIIEDLGIVNPSSEKIKVLLAGNYPFKNADTDHIIVKAPRDQYEGTEIGDRVRLKWNTLSYAYQQNNGLVKTQPFNGTINEIDGEFLTNTFDIVDKIDSILYVPNSTNIPLIGQTVETLTGSGEVSYTYNEEAAVTIYVTNQNGNFGLSGSLFTSIGEFVGEYETQGPVAQTQDVEDYWGGYWKIDLGLSYNTGEINDDEGRGLVFADIFVDEADSSLTSNRYYYNILDFASEAFSSYDIRHSEITSLTYRGAPGPNDVIGTQFSNLYVLRAPKDLTDSINPGDEVEVFYNSLPNFENGEFIDPAEIGISIDELNRTHTVEDVWDGYIDVLLTKENPFSQEGFIEPIEGLKVRPIVQGTPGEAEIAYYQKFDTDSIRLYLKDVTGNWPSGALFAGARDIEFLATEDPNVTDPLYQANRTFGQIQARSLGYEPDGIGKLLVFKTKTGENIPLLEKNRIISPDTRIPEEIPDTDIVAIPEYWFYVEETVQGISREPNIPSPDNNDWLETNRIPVGVGGTASSFEQEGYFSIYQRTGTSNWTEVGSFIVPERKNQARLGSDLRFAQINNLARLFVEAQGNSSPGNKGKIYVIKNGTEGPNQYSWELGSDKRYKGEFSETSSYVEQDVVFFVSKLYQAQTNILPGVFDQNDWIQLEQEFDYLGFLPNETGLILENSEAIEQTNLEQFSQSFDCSDNGEVVVISSRFTSKQENTILIYRNIQGFYQKYQVIEAPNTNTGFAHSIAISNDGKKIAVGIPYDDTVKLNQGAVYIYREIDGEFTLDQELYSPYGERGELFGLDVNWDNNKLAVSVKNSNSTVTTKFDSNRTTFDQEFTNFVDSKENTGTVLVFEDFDSALLYGQTIDLDEQGVKYFGRNILVNENHVYIPLPKFATDDSVGAVVDYAAQKSENLWKILRRIKPTVDVNKIKKVFLYNVKTNELVERLDYIDPLQGKIPGIAEKEIDYKTYFDPAVYTTGSAGRVNAENSWDENQLGKIWWDLTRAKFRNPYQGSPIFSANNWNSLFSEDNEIDVYEWVESDILPSRWDELSGTEEGFTRNITGTTKYGNDAYVEKQFFDSVNKSFSTKYYYWVKDKTTLPSIVSRNLKAKDIADLIRDPKSEGYRFIQLISENEFSLVNCEDLIKDQDIALLIQYFVIDDQSINVHNEYQIITEGLASSQPNSQIERKWFDSLVGFDETRRPVPATELSEKQKYGVLDEPRQGWFVNRTEALKQTVERINKVLAENLIADEKDISRLTEFESEPVVQSGLYDTVVDTVADLQFIGVARAQKAQLKLVIENGKIIDVEIVVPGRGYVNPPVLSINGTGQNADLEAELDNRGSIVNVSIRNAGSYYDSTTTITTRSFSALVKNDEELNGRWAIYERDTETQEWTRKQSQGYNVNLYWNYVDWYAQGYDNSISIDVVIDRSFEIAAINDDIGSIVKIENVGSGGWLLLEKIDDQPNVDYTVNYKTIGRENGTIQISNLLYDIANNLVSYDAGGFDSKFYDSLPSRETRIILETIRDEIFTNELEIEYNNLFFANLRYVFSEQNSIDWAFKTSFVKAQHNVGALEQKLTFKNDNLSNYEEYVNEVKPFRTKLREYLSTYERVERSRSVITDFDLPPRYVETENRILPYRTRLLDNEVGIDNVLELDYPERYWLEAAGFSVQRIEIADAGEGYTSAPVIEIEGGGGSGARAIASVGRDGVITNISVISQGSGYILPPNIRINGSISEGGRSGRAVAVLGGSPIRSFNTAIKFDRVSGDFEFTELLTEERFVGNGDRRNFGLEWPLDTRPNLISVTVDDTEILGGQFDYRNNLDTSKGYERYLGEILFEQPPRENSEIIVRYFKSIEILNAQDRINLNYQPGNSDLGKSLGQLMDGIDYGGVEVRSYGFASTTGWDAQPWFSQAWDIFDTEFEDYIINEKRVTLEFETAVDLEKNTEIFQDSTNAAGTVVDIIDDKTIIASTSILSTFNTKDQIRLEDSSLIGEDSTEHVPDSVYNEKLILNKPLEEGIAYNVYKIGRTEQGMLVSNQRLDDPNFNTSGISNPDAICETLQGDGSTEILTSKLNLSQLEITPNEEIISIIIRKETSDGSFIPDPESYDTALSGGNLNYQTVKGINAEDINIDGDGFVTPTRAKGPEEIVPGQVLDVVDIQVYERPASGGSLITSRNYIGDGSTFVYDIGTKPVKDENVFVKINAQIINDFSIDYQQNRVILGEIPSVDDRVNILNLSNAGLDILDITEFTGDGETFEFLLNLPFSNDIESFVTVNGQVKNVLLNRSDETYDKEGNVLVIFDNAPSEGARINIVITGQGERFINYSQVSIDKFIADGSTTQFTLANNIFAQQPALANTVVTVNSKVLNAGYSETFEVTQSRQYQINQTQLPIGGASSNEIEVYLNGVQLRFLQEWRFTGSAPGPGTDLIGSIIELERGIGEPGDELKVYVIGDAEYRFGFFDASGEFVPQRGEDSTLPVLNLDDAFADGDEITVYSFSNHDGQQIERQSFDVEEKTETTPGTSRYFEYRQLTRGLIRLRKPAIDAQYVWVSQNGNLLNPSVDYYITNDKFFVQLVQEPNQGDEIEVIHFSNTPVTDTFGWRQFKDMLNRNHYKRLVTPVELAEDLNWYDKVIEIADASSLPEPSFNSPNPGVVFINGERIEYFIKDGNTLKQLRRGTLGTGIKERYTAGTPVMDQSNGQTLPYNDEEQVVTITAEGYTDGLNDYENSFGVSIDDVSYDFNNNTAYPLGGQIATVTGTGFRENAQIFVGETECEVIEVIDENTLQFVTPALSIGSYDLILINPEISDSSQDLPRTTGVKTKAINYVQILLPYTPSPETDVIQNPAADGDWYRAPFEEGGIPEDYWQALDIEVFVGGKRLSKAPRQVYNYEAQDSPEGDIEVQAEFAVNKTQGAYVRLSEPPSKGTEVVVIRKTLTEWTDPGMRLAQSDTEVAKFIRQGSTELPR